MLGWSGWWGQPANIIKELGQHAFDKDMRILVASKVEGQARSKSDYFAVSADLLLAEEVKAHMGARLVVKCAVPTGIL